MVAGGVPAADRVDFSEIRSGVDGHVQIGSRQNGMTEEVGLRSGIVVAIPGCDGRFHAEPQGPHGDGLELVGADTALAYGRGKEAVCQIEHPDPGRGFIQELGPFQAQAGAVDQAEHGFDAPVPGKGDHVVHGFDPFRGNSLLLTHRGKGRAADHTQGLVEPANIGGALVFRDNGCDPYTIAGIQGPVNGVLPAETFLDVQPVNGQLLGVVRAHERGIRIQEHPVTFVFCQQHGRGF